MCLSTGLVSLDSSPAAAADHSWSASECQLGDEDELCLQLMTGRESSRTLQWSGLNVILAAAVVALRPQKA